MLIASDRHTDEDLRHWQAFAHGDAVMGARLDRRIERAHDVLRAFVAGGACYAGVSWGKDSVVVAHMVATLCVPVPLVWLRWWPMSNPDCPRVRDAFRARYAVEYHEIETTWERRGGAWVNVDDERDRDGFGSARAWFGERRISGVRASESRARQIRCAVWGESSPNTCAPLARWSAEDVFGYLARFDLPVHPAYAMTMGGALNRSDLRVDCIGGTTGAGRGRREWEWAYYRDELIALDEGLAVGRRFGDGPEWDKYASDDR